ncbi:hypothetical protein [uncultured Kordia sp.]|uniref:hypothetical protein n=1 Tax=uncultured Kordia sp. TaxID=507699 RepID=UPI002602BE5E|nr:hypothetical protein [uncultured Kordia sp.]
MGILAIIKLFIAIIGFGITILTGILLIRHRQLIEYFKSSFSFIRDDYQAEKEIEYGDFFSELFKAIKYGFTSLGKSNSRTAFNENKGKSNEINRILVLIGKLMIVTGVLGILISIVGTLWMIFESRVNINFY